MKLVIDIRAQLHITSEERFVMTSLFLECVRAVNYVWQRRCACTISSPVMTCEG